MLQFVCNHLQQRCFDVNVTTYVRLASTFFYPSMQAMLLEQKPTKKQSKCLLSCHTSLCNCTILNVLYQNVIKLGIVFGNLQIIYLRERERDLSQCVLGEAGSRPSFQWLPNQPFL